jgi:uncharacterized membrane protein YqhA
MRLIERLFENLLWNSRFVVVVAVIASMAAAFTMFFMTTVDVWNAVEHIAHYADPALGAEARKALHDDTITHIVEVVDGYLLGAVLLIFALGLYELFVSNIEAAAKSETASKILLIESLDDLKNRLAKVILMILIVKLFEHAVKLAPNGLLDLLYLGASIALVGLALWLTHHSEGHGESTPKAAAAAPPPGQRPGEGG